MNFRLALEALVCYSKRTETSLPVKRIETMTSENTNASVEGSWGIESTGGEAYDDHTYTTMIGLFDSEEAADAYLEAHNVAAKEAYMAEYNTGYSYWLKKVFIPKAPSQVPNFKLFYEVETSRSWDENGKREVERVSVQLLDFNKQALTPFQQLCWDNPGKAFQTVSPYGVSPEVHAESSEFPALTLSEDGRDYDGQYETFYSFSKDAVVLDPPAGYVHPEPIPWEPPKRFEADKRRNDGSEELADWEKELLGITDED